MTEEDRKLLLKDLSARLPYEVKVQYEDGIFTIDHISAMYEEVKLNTPNNYTIDVLDIKPYLFPLSSMTKEQEKEFNQLLELELKAISDEIDHPQITAFEIDFYNKHHFDWRGLISIGLALDATDKNIY